MPSTVHCRYYLGLQNYQCLGPLEIVSMSNVENPICNLQTLPDTKVCHTIFLQTCNIKLTSQAFNEPRRSGRSPLGLPCTVYTPRPPFLCLFFFVRVSCLCCCRACLLTLFCFPSFNKMEGEGSGQGEGVRFDSEKLPPEIMGAVQMHPSWLVIQTPVPAALQNCHADPKCLENIQTETKFPSLLWAHAGIYILTFPTKNLPYQFPVNLQNHNTNKIMSSTFPYRYYLGLSITNVPAPWKLFL